MFPSTKRFYEATYALTALQASSASDIESNILLFYQKTIQRFLAEKTLIPSGNLVEVAFEDLEREPLAVIRQIYEALHLDGFARMEGNLRDVIAAQAGYRKNQFPLNDDVIRKVSHHWGFALDEWGYTLPSLP